MRDELNTIKATLPEVIKKGAALSALGAGIGDGIGDLVGWNLVGREGHYLFAGAGAVVGIVMSYLIAVLIRKVQLQTLEAVEVRSEKVGYVLSFVLAIAGLIGFILSGKWIGLVGTAFFTLCGIYLLVKSRDTAR